MAGAILALTERRGPAATVCPSEVARALVPDGEGGWRALMPLVREAAAGLRREGRLRVTRRGREVDDPLTARGPLRLGRPPAREGGEEDGTC